MTKVDRWQLPEGIEEVLPDQAIKIEYLRRRLLDLYHRWGYDLVIPPLVEFTDSLLSGSGTDLDLLTFKLTDQLSGRLMGVRADVTPQTARMDAHSLRRNGPNRLCYASTVLYTRPRSPMASRAPILAGVELYGEAGLDADIEVISLLLETLRDTGVSGSSLDLGHVGIYRGLEETLQLDPGRAAELFSLVQSKSCELDAWVAANIHDDALATVLRALPDLNGGEDVLDRARPLLADTSGEVLAALDELEAVVAAIRERYPDIILYLDLGELEGYHYHTGIVFGAYAPGARRAIGNGGRYDDIGESFGRPRPATGFSIDLKALAALVSDGVEPVVPGVYAPASDDPAVARKIDDLRRQGERVVCGFAGQEPDFATLHCDRRLVVNGDRIEIEPV